MKIMKIKKNQSFEHKINNIVKYNLLIKSDIIFYSLYLFFLIKLILFYVNVINFLF